MTVRKIIVPVDFSEHSLSAAAYAMWYADNHQSIIRLLHVVHPETGDLDVPVISAHSTMRRVESAEEVMNVFEESAMLRLKEMYQPRNDIEIEKEVTVGVPSSELRRKVTDAGADAIIMGTRGKHNRLDQMFGSVTTSVLRKATVPVFVIPEKIEKLGISSAGFATDLEPGDAVQIWKTTKLLEPFGSIMRVVHVLKGEAGSKMSIDEMQEFLTGRPLSLHTTFHEVKGDNIEQRLLSFADEYDLDILAFHSPKRNFLERLWHHSVSRNLALFSDVALLSIQ